MAEIPTGTAVIKIQPRNDPEIASFYIEALKLRDYSEARLITEVAHLKPATEDLTIIARLKKAMEEKRKEYVRPLQDHVKTVNDIFKSLMEPIEVADQVTRKKILAFQAEQERIRGEQEEINRLRVEAAQKEAILHNGEISEPVGLVEVIPEAPKRVRTDMGTSGQRMVRRYRVTDFALLPDQYKIENSALLNKVVKAGIPSIPGVEIYEEPILVVIPREG